MVVGVGEAFGFRDAFAEEERFEFLDEFGVVGGDVVCFGVIGFEIVEFQRRLLASGRVCTCRG